MEALNGCHQVRLLNKQMPHALKGGHDNDLAVQLKYLHAVTNYALYINVSDNLHATLLDRTSASPNSLAMPF